MEQWQWSRHSETGKAGFSNKDRAEVPTLASGCSAAVVVSKRFPRLMHYPDQALPGPGTAQTSGSGDVAVKPAKPHLEYIFS